MRTRPQTEETPGGLLALGATAGAPRRSSGPRAALVAAAAVLLLLVVLDVVVYRMSAASVEHVLADFPELGGALKGQLRLHLLLTVLASAAFFVGLFVIGGLEGHRRDGVAAKLISHLERVGGGDYGSEIRLRRDDRLDRLEQAFNRMSRALHDRAWHEAERLERLAQLAAEAQSAEDRQRLHAEIRELAVNLRRALDLGR